MGRRKEFTKEEAAARKKAYRRRWDKTEAGRAAKRRHARNKAQRDKVSRIHAPGYQCPLLKHCDKVLRKLAYEKQLEFWAQERVRKSEERVEAARQRKETAAAKKTAAEQKRLRKAEERAQAKAAKEELRQAAKEERAAVSAARKQCPFFAEARKARARARMKQRQADIYAATKADPGKYLDLVFGNAVRSSLRKRRSHKGGRRWEDVVGYTLSELKQHLEPLFKPGMSWENYGKWHIDHIRPKISFDYTSPEDPGFKECWALENLQPLWNVENWSKHASMPETPTP